MNGLPVHAPWCPAAGVVESHAVCGLTVAELELPGQRAVVALWRAARTAAILTVVFRVGASEHLVALAPHNARELAGALIKAADMLA